MELYFAGGGGHFLPGGAFLSLLQSLGPNDALLTEINRRGGACACAAAACSPGEGTWHPWPGLFGSTVQGLGPGPDSRRATAAAASARIDAATSTSSATSRTVVVAAAPFIVFREE